MPFPTHQDKIRKAEKRIFLSTLYIGKSEKELVLEFSSVSIQRMTIARC